MSMHVVLPRMEEFVIADATRTPRTGVYAEVYRRLLEAAQAEPPRGFFVAFPSASAGNCAIQRMNGFANEDGWHVVYSAPIDGRRQLWLERNDPEPGEGEAA